jgi:hypothetical protein
MPQSTALLHAGGSQANASEDEQSAAGKVADQTTPVGQVRGAEALTD